MIRNLKIIFKTLTLIIFGLQLYSCNLTVDSSESNNFAFKGTKEYFPYDLTQANKILNLSNKLKEISGLGIADPTHLYAINDEAGDLFVLHKVTGKIGTTIDFGKKGDYEGVEMVDGKVYILKSSGTIYELSGDSLQQKEKYDTPLKTVNDVEGLGYDAEKNTLLLACKGSPGVDETLKKSRAIYSFDLKTKALSKTPSYLIRQSAIADFFEGEKLNLIEKIDLAPYKKRATNFAPSAIAIHPKSQNIYILSTVGKTLFVLDKAGTIKHIEFLDKKILRQPEGICFDTDGKLFISSEGAGAKAKLLEFLPQGKK